MESLNHTLNQYEKDLSLLQLELRTIQSLPSVSHLPHPTSSPSLPQPPASFSPPSVPHKSLKTLLNSIPSTTSGESLQRTTTADDSTLNSHFDIPPWASALGQEITQLKLNLNFLTQKMSHSFPLLPSKSDPVDSNPSISIPILKEEFIPLKKDSSPIHPSSPSLQLNWNSFLNKTIPKSKEGSPQVTRLQVLLRRIIEKHQSQPSLTSKASLSSSKSTTTPVTSQRDTLADDLTSEGESIRETIIVHGSSHKKGIKLKVKRPSLKDLKLTLPVPYVSPLPPCPHPHHRPNPHHHNHHQHHQTFPSQNNAYLNKVSINSREGAFQPKLESYHDSFLNLSQAFKFPKVESTRLSTTSNPIHSPSSFLNHGNPSFNPISLPPSLSPLQKQLKPTPPLQRQRKNSSSVSRKNSFSLILSSPPPPTSSSFLHELDTSSLATSIVHSDLSSHAISRESPFQTKDLSYLFSGDTSMSQSLLSVVHSMEEVNHRIPIPIPPTPYKLKSNFKPSRSHFSKLDKPKRNKVDLTFPLRDDWDEIQFVLDKLAQTY